VSTRYPWHVDEEPRPLPNPKPRLGLPLDDPYGEDAQRPHRTCPPASRCSECYPTCVCGRSVGRAGEFCSPCEDAASELPEYDDE
jgi:hypothetical protein